MNVIFDNIIFNLQSGGGISVVWYELLKRAVRDADFTKCFLEYPCANLCRSMLQLPAEQLVMPRNKCMERYRQPSFSAPRGSLFHSSYFRILRQPSVKNITTVHDLTYHFYRQGLARHVHVTQESYALNHSEGIICISESTKYDLLRCYPRLQADKIRVIHNGVSEAYYPVDAAPITHFEKGGYLLYVGNRAAEYKNYFVAVETARLTALPLVIVGSELTEVEQAQLNVLLGEEHWQSLCWQSEKQLNILYNQAFALLYPSSYEGFGLPVLEAQGAGCLVLAQAVSSIPEVAGEAGLLIEPTDDHQLAAEKMADLIQQVKNGRLDRNKYLQNGRTNAARFSWDNAYAQTKAFYRDIDNK